MQVLVSEKLRTILTEVVALERAVDLISEGYFDGHDVLFADSRKELTSSHETARFLIVGYNCFAEENSNEPIDMQYGDSDCCVSGVMRQVLELRKLADRLREHAEQLATRSQELEKLVQRAKPRWSETKPASPHRYPA